jgi:hypothetical protein
MGIVTRKSKTFFIILIIIFSIIALASFVYIKLTSNKLHEIITVEAGTDFPGIYSFTIKENAAANFMTNVSDIDMSTPGVYEIEIIIGKKVYKSLLRVEDTIPPTAEIVNREVWANDEKAAQDFVKNIVDVTEVKVYFKEEPDFSRAGIQEVSIILEDEGGNKTEVTASLTVKEDTEPPKIEGAKNLSVFVGERVSYRRDVTVTDNRDENVGLEIDTSNVNLKKPGTYNVIYSATDSSGNTASVTVTITVKERPADYITQEELDTLSDTVLAKIIKDNMSQKEKAYEIYRWTRSHISYVNNSDKSDWRKAANIGIRKASGDCFVYFATAKQLLTRVGIQNIDIIKSNGGHYWSMINLGDGWYHFDATPRRSGGEFFMLTDAELENYSTNNGNSHIWDKTKYPATPLE